LAKKHGVETSKMLGEKKKKEEKKGEEKKDEKKEIVAAAAASTSEIERNAKQIMKGLTSTQTAPSWSEAQLGSSYLTPPRSELKEVTSVSTPNTEYKEWIASKAKDKGEKKDEEVKEEEKAEEKEENKEEKKDEKEEENPDISKSDTVDDDTDAVLEEEVTLLS